MHPVQCSCRVGVYSTHGQGCTCTTDLARLLSFCTQLASEFMAMNALRPLSFDPVDRQRMECFSKRPCTRLYQWRRRCSNSLYIFDR